MKCGKALPKCSFDVDDYVDASKLAEGSICSSGYSSLFQNGLGCCELNPVLPANPVNIYDEYTTVLNKILAAGDSVSGKTVESVLADMFVKLSN